MHVSQNGLEKSIIKPLEGILLVRSRYESHYPIGYVWVPEQKKHFLLLDCRPACRPAPDRSDWCCTTCFSPLPFRWQLQTATRRLHPIPRIVHPVHPFGTTVAVVQPFKRAVWESGLFSDFLSPLSLLEGTSHSNNSDTTTKKPTTSVPFQADDWIDFIGRAKPPVGNGPSHMQNPYQHGA